MLNNEGHHGTVTHVYHAEIHEETSKAVGTFWNNHKATLDGPEFIKIGEDVYDILRQPARIKEIIQDCDEDTLILIGGGSPCQDLSSLNACPVGITGVKSILFFAIPTIAWGLNRCTRASVQVYGEQVASLNKEAKKAILEALGMPDHHMRVSNASEHSEYVRSRAFYATFDNDEQVEWIPAPR